jgi:hypothetical protein
MITDKELYAIVGGSFSFTATFLNSMSRCINTVLEAGRTFGTSIRMLLSGRSC